MQVPQGINFVLQSDEKSIQNGAGLTFLIE